MGNEVKQVFDTLHSALGRHAVARLAYRDAQGFFWFAGRSGDWLRVDSENLAATPIEAVLSRYEAFAGVAVYAVPDLATGAGDALMLAFESRGAFEPAAFLEWLSSQADWGTKWTPSFLRQVTKLDETATGKITKKLKILTDISDEPQEITVSVQISDNQITASGER